MGIGKMLGGDVKFTEPKVSAKARQRIYNLGRATETMPTQQIAEANPLMQQAFDLAGQYTGSAPSSAYDTSLNLMTGYATNPVDPMSIPGFQGVWDKILSEGTNASRNLQRALKLSGNTATNTSKGLTMLGRQQSDVESQLMGAALPLMQDAYNKQFQAAQLLPGMAQAGENAVQQRIGIGLNTGELMRAIEQAKNDAIFNQMMQDISFRYGTQPGLLKSTMVNPVATTEQGWLAGTNQAVSGLSQLGGNIMGLGTGAGGTLSKLLGGGGGGTGQDQAYMNTLATGGY